MSPYEKTNVSFRALMLIMRSQIPLDHDNSSAGTYENRFWVNDEFYKPGKPIMVYDVGETDGDTVAQAYLTSTLSFFRGLLEELGAMGIAWEHRFVRYSQQGSVTNKQTDTMESRPRLPSPTIYHRKLINTSTLSRPSQIFHTLPAISAARITLTST